MHPVGVFGVLIALAVSPVIGFAFGASGRPRRPPMLRRAHAPAGRAGARRRVGHVGGALVQPRREQRPEGDGCHRRDAGRAGHLDTLTVPLWVKVVSGATLTLGTAMGGWRDHPHRGPAHLPPAPDRRAREPDHLDGRDLRRVVRRRAGVDDPGGRLVGGRRRGGRRRWPTYAGRWCARWASHGSRRCRSPRRSAPARPVWNGVA